MHCKIKYVVCGSVLINYYHHHHDDVYVGRGFVILWLHKIMAIK